MEVLITIARSYKSIADEFMRLRHIEETLARPLHVLSSVQVQIAAERRRLAQQAQMAQKYDSTPADRGAQVSSISSSAEKRKTSPATQSVRGSRKRSTTLQTPQRGQDQRGRRSASASQSGMGVLRGLGQSSWGRAVFLNPQDVRLVTEDLSYSDQQRAEQGLDQPEAGVSKETEEESGGVEHY